MASTILLDTATWDLCLDASGNIAVASEPYSQAQDAASEISLFVGESWYFPDEGVPYFAEVLGWDASVPLMNSLFEAAALKVSGVVRAQSTVTGITKRKVTGQIQIWNTAAQTATAAF